MNLKSCQQIELPDWVLSLCLSPETNSLIAATAKGTLHNLPLDSSKWANPSNITSNINAHQSQINKVLKNPNDPNMVFTCSDDSTLKVWDLRLSFNKSVHSLSNSRQLPFFCMDVNHGLISAGSQLKNTDSELTIWDTRKLESPLRAFIDSHNDDITETKFHPVLNNILISGSTDANLNVYDLNITDEDDALLQCVNYSSIHSAGFLDSKRVYVLSHMETFTTFNLSSKEEIDPETYGELHNEPVRKDIDFGDIREQWDCEYVVDFYAPNYVACGSNSKQNLKIFKFDRQNEIFDPSKNSVWNLYGAHGEEIVRDISIFNNVIFTGGEDNIVKVWNGKDDELENTGLWFFKDDEANEESRTDIGEEQLMDVEYDLSRQTEKETKKEKKKHRKHKKESKSKKHRFNPY